ncbi:AAA family ATPase [Comamonas sp. MYb69]
MTSTVLEYSNDLKSRIEASLVEYAKQSQKLDQSFPQRLLNGFPNVLDAEELFEKMRSVELKRENFKTLGILDKNDTDVSALWSPNLDNLDRSQLSVMSVYVHDMTEKMAILESLSNRIEIFLDVLNRKFTNKTLSINRERGLIVTSVGDQSINVSALSSGEQHELVLVYDLLFKVSPNALVMIDEPELSLHISWQKEFINDIAEIISIAQFDVLMATHSPYIVGDRSDLLVELSSTIDSNKK